MLCVGSLHAKPADGHGESRAAADTLVPNAKWHLQVDSGAGASTSPRCTAYVASGQHVYEVLFPLPQAGSLERGKEGVLVPVAGSVSAQQLGTYGHMHGVQGWA